MDQTCPKGFVQIMSLNRMGARAGGESIYLSLIISLCLYFGSKTLNGLVHVELINISS